MNEFESFKPILTALVLPPVPWLLTILLGARWLRHRPWRGRFAIGLGVALVWLSACQATGRWLHAELGLSPPPLNAEAIAALRTQSDGSVAIVVLGGGLVTDPRRREPELYRSSLERLQHGIRLARSTGLPIAFSGGVGWAQSSIADVSEAEIARRVAAQDFRYDLAWTESASRDTRENAQRTVAQLYPHGVRHLVLVTHAVHMPRAVLEFERAAHGSMRITPAPVNLVASDAEFLQWMPTSDGFELVRSALRESLGLQVARWTSPTATPPPK